MYTKSNVYTQNHVCLSHFKYKQWIELIIRRNWKRQFSSQMLQRSCIIESLVFVRFCEWDFFDNWIQWLFCIAQKGLWMEMTGGFVQIWQEFIAKLPRFFPLWHFPLKMPRNMKHEWSKSSILLLGKKNFWGLFEPRFGIPVLGAIQKQCNAKDST